MSGVKRATVWQADYSWPDDLEVVPAEDYDALAQRCRELEQCMSDPINKLVRERDTLRAEVEQLQQALAEQLGALRAALEETLTSGINWYETAAKSDASELGFVVRARAAIAKAKEAEK